jgi:hypothetical protein
MKTILVDAKDFFYSLLIIFCASLLLLFLSSHTFILTFLLILLAYIKHKLIPIKKELLWYLIVCIGSVLIEVLLVNIGGDWEYSNKHFFNIPIWMAFFWGVIGTSMVVMYDKFVKR